MFRRLLVEDWQRTLTIVSFAIFFSTFLITLVRMALMPRRRAEELASLPLHDDTYETKR